MPRGGYQKPTNPAPVSGPGKFSRRTDGQAASGGNLDMEDVQYGDVGMMEEAQKATPMRGSQGARVNAGSGQRRPSGSVMDGGGLPPYLTQGEDPNPDQPTTAGLDAGPGPGSEILDASTPAEDVREIVLQYLASTFGNEIAAQHLTQIRNERAAAAAPPTPSAPMTSPLSAMAKEPMPAPVGGNAPAPTDAEPIA